MPVCFIAVPITSPFEQTYQPNNNILRNQEVRIQTGHHDIPLHSPHEWALSLFWPTFFILYMYHSQLLIFNYKWIGKTRTCDRIHIIWCLLSPMHIYFFLIQNWFFVSIRELVKRWWILSTKSRVKYSMLSWTSNKTALRSTDSGCNWNDRAQWERRWLSVHPGYSYTMMTSFVDTTTTNDFTHILKNIMGYIICRYPLGSALEFFQESERSNSGWYLDRTETEKNLFWERRCLPPHDPINNSGFFLLLCVTNTLHLSYPSQHVAFPKLFALLSVLSAASSTWDCSWWS